MTQFSIITPLHQIPDTFLECYQSLNQQSESFEWIIILNGNFIEKSQVLKILKDQPIINKTKILHYQGHRGPSGPRNLGIDNAIVEINSQEVPIMDGSAKQFVELILEAGVQISEVPIKIIKVEQQIQITEGEKTISINKSNVSLDIDFEIKYQNQFIKSQRNKISVFEDNLTQIYNSRTFCLFEDIEKLKNMGLGKGGSLENALVVKNNSLMNEDGLRNEKEFVNHKILDCMGDLYLSGYRIIGSLTCSQGGHNLTNKLLRKLFSDHKNYSLFEIKGKSLPHLFANKNQLKSIA